MISSSNMKIHCILPLNVKKYNFSIYDFSHKGENLSF